ncbi:alanine--tRNA ligase [Kineosporia mesophila]|uniref:Alanine--tRNA ligase n=1 Tax=Kineosporia mesophila TaxID=566012 RepID=A0ABP7APR6_9ACTN|nr:alanine--tRNA ligase [Kineosporia mesophila]MCD5349174.1 alanine--tRNA ligase [Kineosporia mesophila]
METAEIRRRWLRYFSTRGHTVVPSAPLLYDDPTLLFVNAGMVPFKPYMLGQETPPYERATSVQKCIRTLDIDEVGKTSRHGTFFQMNGNFSFGDYFKEKAIELAWELITRDQSDGGYGLDESRLWVTVLQGDEESRQLWKRIAGLPDERIVQRGLADNYWHMGVPGPGGPCSEIYFDRGPQYGPDGGPEADEDRYLEIWNLVFMQEMLSEVRTKIDFDVEAPLPSKNIDTGMGLERMASLLQGVDNLYEIDEVFPVIARVEEITGKRYGANPQDDVRMRVIADHVRSGLMLIGDGVTPSNEARGYVLRRLLRRVTRSVRLLGVQDPSMVDLLTVSKDRMGASYPELETNFARISQIALAEEQAFTRTLSSGTTILDTAVASAKSAGETTLSGDRAFQLHDTYGFPIDLTLEMAGEHGLTVDHDGFRRLMAEQRNRAKADAKSKKVGHADTSVYRALREPGITEFTGYRELSTDSTVRGLILDGSPIEVADKGQTVQVVLERTPFYAESGGQIADEGEITADGARLRVLDVQRPVKGLIVHTVEVTEGTISSGADVLASVDREWRLSACQAHSGTHVVHAALRQVLGPTALQSGSFNRPGYLRLDFAWTSALESTVRDELEQVANLALRYDYPVSATYMPIEKARDLGALALFGETYDEEVRVVEMGGAWSRELCGGTHVEHSSQIGAITLIGESSIGAGTRRVEAYVGLDALRFLGRERALVSQLTEALKVRPEELPERVNSLVARLREAEKELEKGRRTALLNAASSLVDSAADVNGIAVVTHDAGPVDPADARALALDVRGRIAGSRAGVVAVAAVAKERPVVVIATNEEARARGVKAGELVREAAKVLGGGGGGKDDVAQGGGTDATKIAEALQRIQSVVAERSV